MKSSKALKTAHTSNSKFGMGDYYGQGVKNPIGRLRTDMIMFQKAPKKINKPPKSLA